MGLQTETTSNKVVIRDSTDGFQHGAVNGSTSKLGFYGATPVAQKAGAAQAALVDSSGGTAAPATGIVTITATYNQAILANAIATLAAQGNAMQAVLVSLGLMKGSA